PPRRPEPCGPRRGAGAGPATADPLGRTANRLRDTRPGVVTSVPVRGGPDPGENHGENHGVLRGRGAAHRTRNRTPVGRGGNGGQTESFRRSDPGSPWRPLPAGNRRPAC